jgi:16S rRNA (guanine527-N7)-methyltransferase
MTKVSNSEISAILEASGIDIRLHPSLIQGIQTYVNALLLWNRKISLTAIVDPEEIVRLHFVESFFANSISAMSRGRLADVGSGAGFPGIPIKMLEPDLHLSLVEANAKKAAFLSEVIRALNLKPAEVLHSRTEDVPNDTPAFDFITARAVGDYKRLLKWARRHLATSGRVVLFIGSDDASNISRGETSWSWRLERIPYSKKRVLLIGSL